MRLLLFLPFLIPLLPACPCSIWSCDPCAALSWLILLLGCVVVDFSGQQYCHDQSCDDERGACFFLHFVFSWSLCSPQSRSACFLFMLFVFAVSLCGDRLNPCASLCSLLGGVSTECLRFPPVQAPLKKPASRLALRMSWLYFVTVDVLLYALCDILS